MLMPRRHHQRGRVVVPILTALQHEDDHDGEEDHMPHTKRVAAPKGGHLLRRD